MVKVIKLQKPSPKARVTAIGEAPLTSAASETTTTAMATKIKASGNQRSAHAVKPIAIRTRTPSCFVEPLGGAVTSIVVMVDPPGPGFFATRLGTGPPARSSELHFRNLIRQGQLRLGPGDDLLHGCAGPSFQQGCTPLGKSDHRQLAHHEVHRPRGGERERP